MTELRSSPEQELARSRGVVRRTVQVMDAFTESGAWGVRELAAHLSVPKSGLHRTLQEMANENLLKLDESGRYVVSSELLRLAASLLQSTDVTRVAHEYLLGARNETGETVLLVSYDDSRQQVIALDRVQSDKPIQFVWGSLREWTDLHLSASGLGILSFLPPTDVVRYFERPRVRSSSELVTMHTLEPELRRIRQRGWAITHGARVRGTTGVCAPVFDGRDLIVGGVVIVWPDREDLNEEAVGKSALVAARAISHALGWRGP